MVSAELLGPQLGLAVPASPGEQEQGGRKEKHVAQTLLGWRTQPPHMLRKSKGCWTGRSRAQNKVLPVCVDKSVHHRHSGQQVVSPPCCSFWVENLTRLAVPMPMTQHLAGRGALPEGAVRLMGGSKPGLPGAPSALCTHGCVSRSLGVGGVQISSLLLGGRSICCIFLPEALY